MKDKASILIVDDEEVVRLSHLRSLASANHRATTAASGPEALRILEQQPMDVVFLDLRMPEQDGITVLRSIKKKWPDCEVIMITGYPTIETAKQALRMGAFHYLIKPVSPDELIRAANEALHIKSWTLRTDPMAANGTAKTEHRESPDAYAGEFARQGGTS